MTTSTTAIAGNEQRPTRMPRDLFVHASKEEDWITLADLVRTIKVHWRKIVLAACITGGIATIGVFAVTPKYQGAALVMVEEQQNHIVDDMNDPAVLSELPSD